MTRVEGFKVLVPPEKGMGVPGCRGFKFRA